MRYEFPWPPKELSPNARVHWRPLAKAKAQYKEDCGWIIHESRVTGKTAFDAGWPPIMAQVTFVVNDRRRRDSDNFLIQLKPCFDALVEMGVLEDDSHDKLKIAEPKWERGTEKKVIVELSAFCDGGS